MDFKPRIEVVTVNGILRQCFVLDDHDQRIAELPLSGIKEQGFANEMSVVTLELLSIRVKHTDRESN